MSKSFDSRFLYFGNRTETLSFRDLSRNLKLTVPDPALSSRMSILMPDGPFSNSIVWIVDIANHVEDVIYVS